MLERVCPIMNFGIFLSVGPTMLNCRRGAQAQIKPTSLRCASLPMTGQQLDIAQRAASFVHQPRRAGDKCSAAGMR